MMIDNERSIFVPLSYPSPFTAPFPHISTAIAEGGRSEEDRGKVHNWDGLSLNITTNRRVCQVSKKRDLRKTATRSLDDTPACRRQGFRKRMAQIYGRFQSSQKTI